MLCRMRSARPTRAQKKARTREQVLDAAADVFPVRGFHRTSLDDIVERAGLTSGAVYSNFGSKAELFLALYQRQMDRWVNDVSSVVGAKSSPGERAQAAGAYWTAFLHEERDWFLLHMEFWAYVMREPELGPRYAAQFGRLRTHVAELLQDTATEYGLELPLSPTDLAAALQALNRGLLIETLADPDSVRDDLFGSLLAVVLETGRGTGPQVCGPRTGRS